MNCYKCGKPAVVHMTDLVVDTDGVKRPMELHLCMIHAMQAGLLAHGMQVSEPVGNVEKVPTSLPASSSPPAPPPAPVAPPVGPVSHSPSAMVPIPKPPSGLVVAAKEGASLDSRACPVCGLTWQQFKQHGQMGCPHDYEFFAARLLPLVKRAQEGATQHVGKMPAHIGPSDPARLVTTARLRRELEYALEAENYEQAARLRDQLKQLGSH